MLDAAMNITSPKNVSCLLVLYDTIAGKCLQIPVNASNTTPTIHMRNRPLWELSSMLQWLRYWFGARPEGEHMDPAGLTNLALTISAIGRNIAEVVKIILDEKPANGPQALALVGHLSAVLIEVQEAHTAALDDHAEAVDRHSTVMEKVAQAVRRQNTLLGQRLKQLEQQTSASDQSADLTRQIRTFKRQITALDKQLRTLERESVFLAHRGEVLKQQGLALTKFGDDIKSLMVLVRIKLERQ
jgi:hypothetical protein